MTDTDPSSTLAGIRERNEHMRSRYGYVGGLLALAGAKDDVPRLLAAVEAALGFHEEFDGHCSSCCDAYGDDVAWPCAELRAITTALTGEETQGE